MDLLNFLQIDLLEFADRQIQQLLKYITAKLNKFLLLVLPHSSQQQLLTHIFRHLIQPPHQIFNQIRLLYFDSRVVSFTPNVINDKLLYFLVGVSVVDVYKFIDVMRLDFICLLLEEVYSRS